MSRGLLRPYRGTPSRTEDSQRCQRRSFVRNRLGLVPAGETEATLAFGTIAHAGAGAWWLTGSLEATMDAVMAACQEHGAALDKRHTPELATEMLTLYTQTARFGAGHWAARDEASWAPILAPDGTPLIERRFEIEAGSYVLSFQCDRAVWHRELPDTKVLVDTKTASRLDKRWYESWLTKLQPKLYIAGNCRFFGWKPEDCLFYIEGLSKRDVGQIEYVQCPQWSSDVVWEALDQFVRRLDDDVQLVEMARRVDGSLDMELLYRIAVTETRANYDACHDFFKPCPLLEICNAPFDERVDLLVSTFEKGTEIEW